MIGGDVKATLSKLGIRPSRKLGQNFLIDPNMRDALVADADPQPGEDILEVGAGLGAMTEKLLAVGCSLTAVEYDCRLVEYLRRRFSRQAGLRLIEGDACNLDYDELFGRRPYRCIANLPYSAGTVILARLAATANPPRELLILLQSEMAHRLTTKPRTKAYGALTVQIQQLYEVQIARRIPREVFYPPPDIASASVRLRLKNDDARMAASDYAFFCCLVKTGFAQRRKKLFKQLAREFGGEATTEAFRITGIGTDTRAEEVTVGQFKKLAHALKQEGKASSAS